MKMIADSITVDGVTYQRAGIVVDGIVYLRADYGQIDVQSMTERVGETLQRRAEDADGIDIEKMAERISRQILKERP